MPEIKYFSPPEAKDHGDFPQHHFDLFIEGKRIGDATLEYLSKPLPLYELTRLRVDPEHQGNHYGSALMDQVETWLKERRKPGVLADTISPEEPAYKMYEKRGWVPVPDVDRLHVYNWPADVPLSVLKGFPLRYTIRAKR